jgi:hypothetical protein
MEAVLFLRNADIYLQVHMLLLPRRPASTTSGKFTDSVFNENKNSLALQMDFSSSKLTLPVHGSFRCAINLQKNHLQFSYNLAQYALFIFPELETIEKIPLLMR